METGQRRRHHFHKSVLQRAVRDAVRRAGIAKRGSSHTLLEDHHDIRTVPELLGHRDVSTTKIYTHVLNRGPAAVRSPVDRMLGLMNIERCEAQTLRTKPVQTAEPHRPKVNVPEPVADGVDS